MLSGQTKSSGASIQSRISPKSERCVSGSGRGLFKAVPEPAHGGDRRTAAFELLAQAMHIDFDGVVAHFLAPAAKVFDELVLAHEATGAQHQDFEQTEFARREIERLAVE